MILNNDVLPKFGIIEQALGGKNLNEIPIGFYVEMIQLWLSSWSGVRNAGHNSEKIPTIQYFSKF